MRGSFRTLAGISALMLVSAPRALAQAPSGAVDPGIRAELEAAREAVWRAYFQGDSAALVRLLPERMTAMPQDRAEIIANARNFAGSGRKYHGIEFTANEFFVSGNVAIVWSHYVVRLTDAAGKPSPMAGRAIELFVKQDGRWINPHWTLREE